MSDSIRDRVLKVIDKQLNKDTSQIKPTDNTLIAVQNVLNRLLT